MNPNVAMFLSFVVVSLFSFLSVAAWAGARADERKAFYRSETLKRLAESGQTAVADYLREEDQTRERQRAERREEFVNGNRLVGMILVVVGVTVMLALYQVVPDAPVYLFGAVPLGIGVVFLANSFFGRTKG